ncbi:hypothetical protein OAT01_14545, partial [Pseudomonadales bacterium]|nr:hypothetical protein [Pseudomonadales bacterium]
MGLLGAAKNIDFLAGFLKLEKTSKYTDFNPVLSVKLYNLLPCQNLRPPITYTTAPAWLPAYRPIAKTSKLLPPSSNNGLQLGVAKVEQ